MELYSRNGVVIMETQNSISQWFDSVSSKRPSPRRAFNRTQEKLDELNISIDISDDIEDIGKEIADVIICLNLLAETLGINLREAVDNKMKINRSRRWHKDGTGFIYHIKDEL